MKSYCRRLLLSAFTAIIALLTSCVKKIEGDSYASNPPQRFFWVTGLDPEKAEYYEELHANPWPGVSRTITECNIRNFSIHKREIEGKLYLFAYLEYVGKDFATDMARMAEDPETIRWWKETDPCQIPLPDAAAKGVIWSETTEVFFQK